MFRNSSILLALAVAPSFNAAGAAEQSDPADERDPFAPIPAVQAEAQAAQVANGNTPAAAVPVPLGQVRTSDGNILQLIDLDGVWRIEGVAAEQMEDVSIARLRLRNAPMSAVAALLSAATGRNVVVSSGAANELVTIDLRSLSVSAAVETVCRVLGLWYREDDNTVLRIMNVNEYRDDLVAVREARTLIIPVHYPSAASVAEQLAQLYGDRLLVGTAVDRDVWTGADTSEAEEGAGDDDSGSAEGAEVTRERADRLEELVRVTVDEAANALVIRSADDGALEEIAALVKQMDQPTAQVLLEVKILQVRLLDGENTAIGVNFNDAGGAAPTPIPTNGLSTFDNNAVLDRLVDDELSRLFAFGTSAATAINTTAGGVVYNYLDEHLELRLEALAQEDRLSALGTPLVLCANNRESVIDVGEERPIVTDAEITSVQTGTDGNNNPVFQSVQTPVYQTQLIGTSLTVRPRINRNRTVTLQVEQTSSSLNENGATISLLSGATLVPTPIDTVTTSSVEGTVVARHGLTLVMGGLVQESLSETVDKVPLLGDIPLLGALFRDRSESAQRTELIVLFTPYILDTPEFFGEELTSERLEAISRHPWKRFGDDALDVFGDSAAPHRDEELWYVPLLSPFPNF